MKYTGEEYCEDSQNFEIKIFENSIPVEIDFFERKIIFCNEGVWTGIKIKSFEETMELIKKDIEKIRYDKKFEIIKNNKVVGAVKIIKIVNEKIIKYKNKE
jgi:hypothetical protein